MLTGLMLHLVIWPASFSYAQHGASSTRAFSPVLLWQCEPDFSVSVSCLFEVTWDVMPATQCGQRWILRREGPETHVALSLPLSRAVSN